MANFFISYNSVDDEWAEWIAWQLEAAGYTTTVQAWDFRPGMNFVWEMDKAAATAERTILVLSPDYLAARFTQPEWTAAFARDPTGEQGLVLPVRVRECDPQGLLSQIVCIDLIDLPETEAKEKLLTGARRGRAKPPIPPRFPTKVPPAGFERPRFPGMLPLPPAVPPWEPESTHDTDSRNRRAMLEKVWAMWIAGLLRQSLHTQGLLVVGMAERPAAVARPLDPLVQRPDCADRPLPSGKGVVDIFDEMGKALLILGAPGVGKTMQLLELAAELLHRASRDKTHPIPVVLPLSTWAEQQCPLEDWLVGELGMRYDVPRKIAQTWVNNDRILPLLDGLDEVKAEHRAACAEAINAFRQRHGLLPLAVCSREDDYRALDQRLRLQGAIIVRPLTREQVDAYLAQGGEPLEAVRHAVQDDPTLWELLDTPLLLSIVVLTYAGKPIAELQAEGTLEGRRRRLFAAYLDQMFQRRGVETRYTPEQTRRWLAWLAWQMVQHSQTMFYIERMQPDWLSQGQRRVMGIVVGLCVGLSIGLLCGLSTFLASDKLGDGLTTGLGMGLFSGLVAAIIAASVETHIQTVETIHWRWSIVLPRFVLGLFVGIIVSLLHGGGVGGAAIFALIVSIGLAILELARTGTARELGTKTAPNQGIHRSARYALTFGLGLTLLFGLLIFFLVTQGDIEWLDDGAPGHYPLAWVSSRPVRSLLDILCRSAILGLLLGLYIGGGACILHFALRLLLYCIGLVPWNYPAFLNFAAERIFLRRVGGGYIFVHRSLMEYFASLHSGDGEVSRPAVPALMSVKAYYLTEEWLIRTPWWQKYYLFNRGCCKGDMELTRETIRFTSYKHLEHSFVVKLTDIVDVLRSTYKEFPDYFVTDAWLINKLGFKAEPYDWENTVEYLVLKFRDGNEVRTVNLAPRGGENCITLIRNAIRSYSINY